MGSYNSYYKSALAQNNSKVDEEYAKKKEQADKYLAELDEIINKGAEKATVGYRQSMEQAPLDALQDKEDNALREAINRKIVEENMANMGLTDSGLNRTQQTALALQRGNADVKVDEATTEYVHKLQMAIDDVLSSAEIEKTQNRVTVEQGLDDWLTAARLTADQSAQEIATRRYTADQQAYAARIEAQQKAAQENDNNRKQYAMSRISNGVDSELAWAEAYTYFPSGDSKVDAANASYYYAYTQATREGYTDDQARKIAVLASNGEEYTRATLKTTSVDGISSWDDAYASWISKGFTEFMDSYGGTIIDRALKWDEPQWSTSIERMADKAKRRVEESNKGIGSYQKNYLAAKAVISTISQPLAIVNNDYAIKAIEREFGEEITEKVLEDMGMYIA